MILDMAHFIAREVRRLGHGDVEVRALALVSMKGRNPHLEDHDRGTPIH